MNQAEAQKPGWQGSIVTQKVFARITENLLNYPDTYRIIYSGQIGICPDYLKNFQPVLKLSKYFPFRNCLDFSRWFPIFRTVSKLSRFFQTIANFLNCFKAIRNFSYDIPFSRRFQNCPDFSRLLPILRLISKQDFYILQFFWGLLKKSIFNKNI